MVDNHCHQISYTNHYAQVSEVSGPCLHILMNSDHYFVITEQFHGWPFSMHAHSLVLNFGTTRHVASATSVFKQPTTLRCGCSQPSSGTKMIAYLRWSIKVSLFSTNIDVEPNRLLTVFPSVRSTVNWHFSRSTGLCRLINAILFAIKMAVPVELSVPGRVHFSVLGELSVPSNRD
jgi:hypothetical protein